MLAAAQFGCAISQTVPVLAYHRVSADDIPPSPESIQVSRFEEELKMIKQSGYNTITASELAELMKAKRPMPPQTVVLTFDDGWKTSIVAQKILEKYNMKGTFYIVSGLVNTEGYVTKQELLELSKKPNVEIGSHTHTHLLAWKQEELGGVDSKVFIDEMKMSKSFIEEIIKKPVTAFAWPYGFVNNDAQKAAPALGYTSLGEINNITTNNADISPFHMERLNIDGSCTTAQVKRMIETGVLDKCK